MAGSPQVRSRDVVNARTNVCDTRSGPVESQASDINLAGGVRSDIQGEFTSSQDKIASTNLAEVTKTELSKPVDPVLVDGWSQLWYVDVDICGLPGSIMALNDSAAQLVVLSCLM